MFLKHIQNRLDILQIVHPRTLLSFLAEGHRTLEDVELDVDSIGFNVRLDSAENLDSN